MSRFNAIRERSQVTWKKVRCPEWDSDGDRVTLWVRNLDGPSRKDIEVWAMKDAADLKSNPTALKLRTLKSCVYEDVDGSQGGRFFPSDLSEDDLLDLNTAAVERLYDCANSLSGITKKDIEDLEGN